MNQEWSLQRFGQGSNGWLQLRLGSQRRNEQVRRESRGSVPSPGPQLQDAVESKTAAEASTTVPHVQGLYHRKPLALSIAKQRHQRIFSSSKAPGAGGSQKLNLAFHVWACPAAPVADITDTQTCQSLDPLACSLAGELWAASGKGVTRGL